MHERLLQRQIRRHLGPAWEMPDEMTPLFTAIAATYQQFEQGRDLMERSVDISSRELMEANERLRRESREQFRLLADNATDVVAKWDRHGVCTYASPSCRFFLGYHPDELVGRSVLRVIHPEDFHLLRDGIRQVLVGAERVAVILRLRHRTKGWLWFESSGRAVRNKEGKVVEFQTASRDVEARVAAQQRVVALNRELRIANARLQKGLDMEKEQVRALEELNTMKSDFVSSVSHELRTPLASIIGFAQTLLSDRSMPDETETEFLGIILQEGRRLAKLINDMLDLARIESGRIHVERRKTDIAELAATAVETISMQAYNQEIELAYPRPDLPVVADCDPDRVSQIIVNLLSNAVKFTPKGGSVRLCLSQDDRSAFISVIDTGLGVPAEDIPNLFTRFYRVHRPGMDIRGTGLGLAIVKQLVELHDGSIEVTSRPGIGSTFTVRLPKS